MKFASAKALIGWSFQMETICLCKVQKFDDSKAPSFGALSMHDQKTQAAMVMAKVARLAYNERLVLWAYFTERAGEVMALADLMPLDLPLNIRVELVKHWLVQDVPGKAHRPKTAHHLAEQCKVSDATMCRNKRRVMVECDRLFRSALLSIEIQHLDLIEFPSVANMSRGSHMAACKAA
ncbi:hypothetical protein [Chitiniphilus shinanonensis]|uniref:hypothetical protein n=1 Tax=Chitiniphilus shinanonensis TaxID=553088 RepID=UPI00303D30F5